MLSCDGWVGGEVFRLNRLPRVCAAVAGVVLVVDLPEGDTRLLEQELEEASLVLILTKLLWMELPVVLMGVFVSVKCWLSEVVPSIVHCR